MLTLLISITLLLTVTTSSAASNNIYVNGSHGNDSNDGSTWELAKATIQNGLDTVNQNGTVHVASGTYKENLNIPRNMTIIGANHHNTIVNGQGVFVVINIDKGISVKIANFTIEDGYLYPMFGHAGGIFNGGNCTLINCTIRNNTAYQYGGGLDNEGTSTIINCTIQGNHGGGIYNNGNCTIIGSTINSNTAFNGAGIYNTLGSMLIIKNCTISNNTGDNGSNGSDGNYNDNHKGGNGGSDGNGGVGGFGGAIYKLER